MTRELRELYLDGIPVDLSISIVNCNKYYGLYQAMHVYVSHFTTKPWHLLLWPRDCESPRRKRCEACQLSWNFLNLAIIQRVEQLGEPFPLIIVAMAPTEIVIYIGH
jgi:hypothetical protein